MPRPHDSRLEKRLDTDIRRLASSWRIEREVAVIRTGRTPSGRMRLSFPDFALVSERGRVLVEVVGYWTPEYLASKVELLRAADVPMVLCVDERHVETIGAVRRDPRVLTFAKRIDAAGLVDACESLLRP